MATVAEIERRREAILRQLRDMRSMRRGTINEQYLRVRLKSQEEPVLRGPYYVLSRREGKGTVSQRLTTSEELAQARKDVAAHKRFVGLCQELERLTERLGELEGEGPDRETKRRRRRSPPVSG